MDASAGCSTCPGVFVLGSNDYFAPSLRNPAKYLLPDDGERHVHTPQLPWRAMVATSVRRAGWTSPTGGAPSRSAAPRSPSPASTTRTSTTTTCPPSPGRPTPRRGLRLGVAHAPYLRVLDQFASDGYDLILAGHTHGGQLRRAVQGCAGDQLRPRAGPGPGTPPPPRGLSSRRPGSVLAARLRRRRHLAVRRRAVRLPAGGDTAAAHSAQLTVRPDFGPGRASDRLRDAPRAVAQFGSALRSGRRGRRFKSCQPDPSREPRPLVGALVVSRPRRGLPAASRSPPAGQDGPVHHILAATDLSPLSLDAVARARLLAAAADADLSVLHALGSDLTSPLRELLGDDITHQADRAAAAARESPRRRPRAHVPGTPGRPRGRGRAAGHGRAGVRPRGRGRPRRAGRPRRRHAAPDAVRVHRSHLLRQCDVPVLVVRTPPEAAPPPGPRRGRPLPGVATSPRRGPEVAPEADLVLLHAASGRRRGPQGRARPLGSGRRAGPRAAPRSCARPSVTRPSRSSRTRRTHGCDLVAMGKHGTRVARGAQLGSVTKAVLEEATTDVLVLVDPERPSAADVRAVEPPR